MDKSPDKVINLNKMVTASKRIESILNEIILNKGLSSEETKVLAQQCLVAVNEYTEITNKNIGHLKEQAQEMWEKVKFVLDESVINDPDSQDESDIEIN
ncbi:hypothetical protein KJ966_18945 [bacterium]|nr:hypothetical protein [bacterium]